jgi:hypothetical protein
VHGGIREAAASERLRSTARRLRWGVSTVRRGLRSKRKPKPWPPEAIAARRTYESHLGELVAGGIDCAPSVPLDVVSFSSRDNLPEQVANIRSFLANAGVPNSFTVVSDGTHAEAARDLLRGIHPCVAVADWRSRARPGLPRVLWDYASVDRMGKKLMMLVSLPGDRPVVYTDADILFFAGARQLGKMGGLDGAPRYMCDAQLRRSGPLAGQAALDGALLRDSGEARETVNSGLIFISGPLDWSLALRRLDRLRWKPATFTEQTVVHLTLHQAGARSLDPSRYILTVDDQSLADDPYIGPETVLRHYVTPVRHKFWITLFEYGSAA